MRNLFKTKRQITPTAQQDPQWYKLQENMAAAGVTHGQKIRARITGADIVQERHGLGVKFCFSSLQLLETMQPGDGGALPENGNLVFKTGKKLRPGKVNFEALIVSNGALHMEVLGGTVNQM